MHAQVSKRPALLGSVGLRVWQVHQRHLPVILRTVAGGRRTVKRMIPVLMILALASSVRAQAPQGAPRDLTAIEADLAQIKADLAAVKNQLGQLMRLLSQRPADGRIATSGPVRTNLGEAPMLGRADAPVTIVEFSDYQCPFCQRFFATTLSAIKKHYIDTGKVRYVFRDFPLDQRHPHARKAAVASRVMWKKRNGAFFRVDEVHDQPAAWQGGHRRNAPWARVSGSQELRMSPSGSRWAS